ncbi:MAG: phosphotransferase family protein [Chloroflexota bacterium]
MSNATQSCRLEQIASMIATGARLTRTWALTGGVSATVTGLEIELPDGRTERLIVRQHGERDRRRDPEVAAVEFRLLHILRRLGMPVPAPRLLGRPGDPSPDPFIVVDCIEGQTEFVEQPGMITRMADQLACIHRIVAGEHDLSFLPRHSEQIADKLRHHPAVLDESLSEGRIRAALESAWPWVQHNESALLHGDYWPGNILWRDGHLAGIIDWEDAAIGDPLADLGNSRLEILWAFGPAAMQEFTHHYQSLAPLDYSTLPYWDLCAALRPAGRIGAWGLAAAAERRLRELHRSFVGAALSRLPDRR